LKEFKRCKNCQTLYRIGMEKVIRDRSFSRAGAAADRQVGMSARVSAAVLFFLVMATLGRGDDGLIHLGLPTDNTALLRGDGADFYQVVERNLHGTISFPWQGGQYGFVRDPRDLNGETVYTRFHEGMDVRPVHRDVHGEPLDEVRAIAEGHVVYTSQIPGA